MAQARIDVVGPAELPLLLELYNQVFKPPRDRKSFERRFLGRHNPVILIAHLDDRPVGFFTGFELKPTTMFAWLVGVLPDFRRAGIATQLLAAGEAWAGQHEYHSMRLECHNQHRPMLHLCITHQYDIVGIRWDPDRGDNLVIFEKLLEQI